MKVLVSLSWDEERAKKLARPGDYFVKADIKPAVDLEEVIKVAGEVVTDALKALKNILEKDNVDEVEFVVNTGNPVMDHLIISSVVGLASAAYQEGKLDLKYLVTSPCFGYSKENGKVKKKFLGWTRVDVKKYFEMAKQGQ